MLSSISQSAIYKFHVHHARDQGERDYSKGLRDALLCMNLSNEPNRLSIIPQQTADIP